MKQAKWKIYAFWILLSEAVGALSGFLTKNGTKLYQLTVKKPPLTPPGSVFPIVWSVLFALMGIGAARVYSEVKSCERTRALTLFLVQLAFNFFWSIIYFNFQAYGFALLWLGILWLLIAAMIFAFARVDKAAAYLQVPYLLWVTFAFYLNFGTWQLNG